MVYLYLNKEVVSDSYLKENERASRKEFKNFCKLNAQDKRIIFELHCFTLHYMYLLWKKEIAKIGED